MVGYASDKYSTIQIYVHKYVIYLCKFQIRDICNMSKNTSNTANLKY